MPPEMRQFHLGDILSITTGLLVSPRHIDGIYDLLNFMTGDDLFTCRYASPRRFQRTNLLNFMTGDDLFTHQLPRASNECKPELLRQHPDLADVEVPARFGGKPDVIAWLSAQVSRYGEHRHVAPLAPGDHIRMDPISEFKLAYPDRRVIVPEVDQTGRVRLREV